MSKDSTISYQKQSKCPKFGREETLTDSHPYFGKKQEAYLSEMDFEYEKKIIARDDAILQALADEIEAKKRRSTKEEIPISAQTNRSRASKDSSVDQVQRNGREINYSKWDKLAAQLSDSDSSCPSHFEEFTKKAALNGIDIGKLTLGRNRKRLSISSIKESYSHRRESDRAERMNGRKSTLPKRSPVTEHLSTSTTSFSWKFVVNVSDFSKKNARPLSSPIETDENGLKWRLIFYPISEKNEEYVSIFLEVPESQELPYGWSRKVNFAITLVNKSLTNLLESIDPDDRAKYVPENVITSKTLPDCHVFKGLNGGSSWGWSKFMKAIEFVNPTSADQVELELLATLEVLEQHIEPQKEDLLSYMSAACDEGNEVDLRKCLVLQEKYKLNVINKLHRADNAPLHYLCMSGNNCLKCAELLIENGADLDIINSEKETPLLLASFYEKTQMVKLLIEKGASISIGPSSNGLCCVGAAAQNGNSPIVELLVKADPKSIDGLAPDCCVPLKQALQTKQWDCALTLVQLGAKTVRSGRETDEYMLFVAKYGPEDCKLLFALADRGCAPNVVDKEGNCPLHCLLFERKLSSMAFKLWIEYGASVKLIGNRNKQQRARLLLQLEAKKAGKAIKMSPTSKEKKKKQRDVDGGAFADILKSIGDNKSGRGVKKHLRDEFRNIHASLEMISPPGSGVSAKKSLVLTSTSPKAISAAVGTLATYFEKFDVEGNGAAKRRALVKEVKESLKTSTPDAWSDFEDGKRTRITFTNGKEVDDFEDTLFDEVNKIRSRLREKKKVTDPAEKAALEKEMQLQSAKADEIAQQLLLEEEEKQKKEIHQKNRKRKKRKKRRQRNKDKDKVSESSRAQPDDIEVLHETIKEDDVTRSKKEPEPGKIPDDIGLDEKRSTKSTLGSNTLYENAFDLTGEGEALSEHVQNDVPVNVTANDILKSLLLQIGGFIQFTDEAVDGLLSLASPMEEVILLEALSENSEGLRGIVTESNSFLLYKDKLKGLEILSLIDNKENSENSTEFPDMSMNLNLPYLAQELGYEQTAERFPKESTVNLNVSGSPLRSMFTETPSTPAASDFNPLPKSFFDDNIPTEGELFGKNRQEMYAPGYEDSQYRLPPNPPYFQANVGEPGVIGVPPGYPPRAFAQYPPYVLPNPPGYFQESQTGTGVPLGGNLRPPAYNAYWNEKNYDR